MATEEQMIRVELLRMTQGNVDHAITMERYVFGDYNAAAQPLTSDAVGDTCMKAVGDSQPMTERDAALAAMTSAAVWKREYSLQLEALAKQENTLQEEISKVQKLYHEKHNELIDAQRAWLDTL